MSENLHRFMENNHSIINTAAGGTVVFAPAVAQQRVGVYRLLLITNAAVTVTFQDTSGAALSAPYTFGTNGGSITLDIPINGDMWWLSSLGLGMQLVISAAVQVSADVYWMQGP